MDILTAIHILLTYPTHMQNYKNHNILISIQNGSYLKILLSSK